MLPYARCWESALGINTIQIPLRADADRRHRTLIDEQQGKLALTEDRIIQALRCSKPYPAPVVPHQIRVRLAHVGFPILADSLYGNPEHPAHQSLPRLGLHAKTLSLEHPLTGKPLYFEAQT